ncbi:MAG: hypothetical protein M1812_006843 [Candelaria pacifica]|nr:MAG: hypothetical protein M1812_006843 [Candelaria pacifica]
MKVFETECTFDYSWDEVTTANWRKYCPWNDKATHVTAVDTISRSVDPATGILRTERIITCQQSAPRWINALLGNKEVSHVYETSYVDPVNKKVTMCSTNMTFASIISCRETVTYQPLKSAPQSKTEFKQDAKITALCGGWQRVKNSLEEFSIERFGQNAKKGREGFEAVLEMSRRAFGEQKEQQRREQKLS